MKLFESATFEVVQVDGTNYTLSAGTSDVNSDPIDCANCDEVAILVNLGAMAASGTVDMKLQESEDGSTGWADLEGTALTQADEDDDNKWFGVSVKNPLKRYIRAAFTRGDGGNSTINSMIAIKNHMRKQPITQSTGAGQFVAVEKFVSPVAGTA